MVRRRGTSPATVLTMSTVFALGVLHGCVGDEPTTTVQAGEDGGASSDATPESGVPPGCDAAKDPKDQPCLLVDSAGVFVAPLGDDGNPGTKARPTRTIGEGLRKARGQGKTRVFICDGTYGEAVVLDGNTDGISLYGGFACDDFHYSGFRPKIQPPAAGYALKIDALAKSVRLQDLEFVARDAAAPGESSVAAFMSGSSSVTWKRVKIVAGRGADGAPGGAPPASNHVAAAQLKGNTSSSTTAQLTPGPACACPSYGTSRGGDGGNSLSASPPTPGSATPAVGTSNAGGNNASGCTAGGAGAHGVARLGGSPATALGALTGLVWSATTGGSGEAGNPGQGGGGGGTGPGPGGFAPGSGGCGSCGGAGGLGGGGGGASIAVLAINSAVVMLESVIVAGAGGRGGAGGAGESANAGGAAGAGLDTGCGGGAGGTGAGGAGGGGGTGGISVGIAHAQSPPPAIDGVPQQDAPTLGNVTLGLAGTGGPAGLGGTNTFGGNPGASGLGGKAGVVRAVFPL